MAGRNEVTMIKRILWMGVAAAIFSGAPVRTWSQIQRLPPIELLAEAPPSTTEAPPALPEAVPAGPVVVESTVSENAPAGGESVPSFLAPGTELGDPPLDLPWYNPAV